MNIPQFKQTNIGRIPVDWEVISYDKAFNFLSTASYSKAELINKGEIKYIHYGEIHTKLKHFIDFSKYEPKSIKKEQLKSYPKIKEGDIIMADASEDYSGICKSVEVKNIKNIIAISGLHTFLLRDKNNYFINGFKGYLDSIKVIKNQFDKLATGLKVYGVSKGNLKLVQIPLPPLPEQEAIAEVLSDTDALIIALKKCIVKKRNIKQGAMQKLLTPKPDWKVKSIFELAEYKKQLFDDGDWIELEHITDSGIRFIQTGNIGVSKYLERKNKKYIYPESFIKLNCKLLLKGDLLICRLAEPAGRACIFPDIHEPKVVTSVDVTIFRPNKINVNRAFLNYVFSSNEWFTKVYESVGGTTHKRISRGSLGKIEIHIPPFSEQTHIATILSDMDDEIDALESKMVKTKNLKLGLMQQLLTGKIRLV